MKKVRKAIIPVAGMGTRFLPITKSVAKEMLPIVDKPTLSYIIDEAVDSGITDILLITNPYKKIIEDYFDVNYELEKRMEEKNKQHELNLLKSTKGNVNIYFIRQGEPLGSGHAIKLAKNFVGDEPFAVLYGDDLMKSDKPALKQLIDLYEEKDANVIGCLPVDKNLVYKYGIISFADETTKRIKTIVEKPKIEEAPSNIAGLGRYIVKPEIFEELESLSKGAGGEYQFTDAMKSLMDRQEFYACLIDATYYDTGSKIGYLKAIIDYSLEREELSQELIEYINKIKK